MTILNNTCRSGGLALAASVMAVYFVLIAAAPAQDRMPLPDELCDPTKGDCFSRSEDEAPVFDPRSGNDLILEPTLDQDTIYANESDNVYAVEPAAAAEGFDENGEAADTMASPDVNVIDENMTVVENCLEWTGPNRETYCGQKVTCDRFENGTCYFNSFQCVAFTDGKCYVMRAN